MNIEARPYVAQLDENSHALSHGHNVSFASPSPPPPLTTTINTHSMFFFLLYLSSSSSSLSSTFWFDTVFVAFGHSQLPGPDLFRLWNLFGLNIPPLIRIQSPTLSCSGTHKIQQSFFFYSKLCRKNKFSPIVAVSVRVAVERSLPK